MTEDFAQLLESAVRDYWLALAGALGWSLVHVARWARDDRTHHERDSLWSIFVFALAFWATMDNLRVFWMLDGTAQLAIWLLSKAAWRAGVALGLLLLVLLPGLLVTSSPSIRRRVLPLVAVAVSLGTVILDYLLVISIYTDSWPAPSQP